MDQEIDFKAVGLALWARKIWILLTSLIFLGFGAFYAYQQPDMYRASALLVASNDLQSEGDGRIGSIASLAGINVGSGKVDKITIAKEILQSRKFLSKFLTERRIAQFLTDDAAWDSSSEKWVKKNRELKVFEGSTQENKQELSIKELLELTEKFKKEHLSVQDYKEDGMTLISVKSASPIASKHWTKWLIDDINQYMQERDKERSEERVAYLQAQLKKTSVSDMQKVFYQMIEAELKTIMLASQTDEYAFQVIDPPVKPTRASGPKRPQIIIMSGMLGLILASLVTVFLSRIRPQVE